MTDPANDTLPPSTPRDQPVRPAEVPAAEDVAVRWTVARAVARLEAVRPTGRPHP